MIEESIDWNKVVDMVIETIPQSNVDKIRQESDSIKLEEYKSLVDFLISKLALSQINKVKYLAYWRTDSSLSQAKFAGRTVASTASKGYDKVDDASGGCLSELVSRVIGIAIVIFIIWLLAAIFG